MALLTGIHVENGNLFFTGQHVIAVIHFNRGLFLIERTVVDEFISLEVSDQIVERAALRIENNFLVLTILDICVKSDTGLLQVACRGNFFCLFAREILLHENLYANAFFLKKGFVISCPDIHRIIRIRILQQILKSRIGIGIGRQETLKFHRLTFADCIQRFLSKRTTLKIYFYGAAGKTADADAGGTLFRTDRKVNAVPRVQHHAGNQKCRHRCLHSSRHSPFHHFLPSYLFSTLLSCVLHCQIAEFSIYCTKPAAGIHGSTTRIPAASLRQSLIYTKICFV